MLLVASALASMRWLLCGAKMRVQKKKQTIFEIAHNLSRRGFVSITVLIKSKIAPHQFTNILGVYYFEKHNICICNHFFRDGSSCNIRSQFLRRGCQILGIVQASRGLSSRGNPESQRSMVLETAL